MPSYYNENDPFAAAWLRELIKANLIAPGEVDERSIEEVKPDDLKGYTQCHFFAGGGGWSYALRLAGWPDVRPVWTGSCPCQPWSVASEKRGHEDERDLWPTFATLVSKCGPATVFGEQVTGAIRWGWLDRAFADMEKEGYACGSAVLPATSVGADHERKRLYFVAHTSGPRRKRFIPNNGLSSGSRKTFAVNGDAITRARYALEGCYRDLLPCDGLSVQLERNAIKVFGNAIVPQVAQAFIESYLEAV